MFFVDDVHFVVVDRFADRNVDHMIRNAFANAMRRCSDGALRRPVNIHDVDLIAKLALECTNLLAIESFARNGNDFDLRQSVEPFFRQVRSQLIEKDGRQNRNDRGACPLNGDCKVLNGHALFRGQKIKLCPVEEGPDRIPHGCVKAVCSKLG
ncbi:hypothetical protein D1872_279290 [compost metagenome]